jgi:hypothetical protein
MKALRNSYDEGLRQLIMPKKETYEEELIGAKIFPAGIGYVHRKNFSIKNEDG